MPDHTPILLLGAGRLGGAMLDGWGLTKAFAPADILICDPQPGPSAQAAAAAGARLNPDRGELMRPRTVLLAVKPQVWRDAAMAYGPAISDQAVIVSVAAGVRSADIAEAFGSASVARVMPITAVAVAEGAAAIYAPDPRARAAAHALFDPVARSVDLQDEALMDAVTAVCGSAPAYLYAFTEALEAAGEAEGLPPEAARTLARATMAGAAALMARSGVDPAELRRQVTSPGGTTEAALKVLMSEYEGLGPLLRRAVAAAAQRSRELSNS
jgi:pyrroline-5-carboxylate reductase